MISCPLNGGQAYQIVLVCCHCHELCFREVHRMHLLHILLVQVTEDVQSRLVLVHGVENNLYYG